MPNLIIATVGGESAVHHDHLSKLQTIFQEPGRESLR